MSRLTLFNGTRGTLLLLLVCIRSPGNELFLEVPADYIEKSAGQVDLFLNGVAMPYYRSALDMILGVDEPTSNLGDRKAAAVESSAVQLYGLIHARYILTSSGLWAARERFIRGGFGRCPRIFCNGNPIIPVGETDRPQEQAVRVYCPRCKDVFYAAADRSASHHDGAYWGTTFPHLLLLEFPELLPSSGNSKKYEGRVFGFKVREKHK